MDAEAELSDMVIESFKLVSEQRCEAASRSRRLNNFLFQTMTEQTVAIAGRKKPKPFDFGQLSEIINVDLCKGEDQNDGALEH